MKKNCRKNEVSNPSHHRDLEPHFTRKKGVFHFKNPYLPSGDEHNFYFMVTSMPIPRATKYIKLTERKNSSAKLPSVDYILCGK
jgi:hypothetical protein